MANAYTVEQNEAYMADKTWNELPDERQESITIHLNTQQLPGWYLIVPPFRADDLATLVEGRGNQVSSVQLINGDLVVPMDSLGDLDTFGYAHEFLSGLTIRKVEDSEFPVSDV